MNNIAEDRYIHPQPNHALAFDDERKRQFLDLYRANGLKCKAACKSLGLSFHTIQHHYRIDPAFKSAFDDLQAEYAEELQAKSMQYAMEQKNFMDRCMQLRRLLPNEYAPEKLNGPTHIVINIDGKLLERSKQHEQVIDAKIVEEQQKRVLVIDGKELSTGDQK